MPFPKRPRGPCGADRLLQSEGASGCEGVPRREDTRRTVSEQSAGLLGHRAPLRRPEVSASRSERARPRAGRFPRAELGKVTQRAREPELRAAVRRIVADNGDLTPDNREQQHPADLLFVAFVIRVHGDGGDPPVGREERAPHAHHAGQVKDGVDALQRRHERLRPAHVATIDRDVALLEPGRVLAGQGEHADAVAAGMQCRNEVASQQAISSGDEYLHR